MAARRTPKEISSILQRLAVDDVERHRQNMEVLRLHLMPERASLRFSEEEVMELVGRVYYDGVEDSGDRREQLEDKWLPHKPCKAYNTQQINSIVDRLTHDNIVYDRNATPPAPRRPSPDTLEAHRRNRAAVAASVERLYTADTDTRRRHAEERFDRLAAHPSPTRRLMSSEQGALVDRLTSRAQ